MKCTWTGCPNERELGRTKCGKHLAYYRNYAKQARAKDPATARKNENARRSRRLAERMSKGQCFCCTNPHVPGRKMCKDHLAKIVANTNRYRYGIEQGDVDRLFLEQQGKCALCGVPFGDSKGSSPSIDHDHSTGAIRGLIHNTCNLAIGQFRDQPQLLRAAIDYLARHDGR